MIYREHWDFDSVEALEAEAAAETEEHETGEEFDGEEFDDEEVYGDDSREVESEEEEEDYPCYCVQMDVDSWSDRNCPRHNMRVRMEW
jgi:hypothetical protein